jgi:hypothetical protein
MCPCNKLLLAGSIAESRARPAGGKLDVGRVRSRPGSDIEDGAADGRMIPPEPPRLVHELADSFVTRSRDTDSLGLGSDQSIDVRDRERLLGESLDEVEHRRRESRRESQGPIVVHRE